MPSVAQMYKQYVNKRVAVTVAPGVEVAAVCTDARMAYGRPHLLVQPIMGKGSMWIGLNATRVVPNDWPKQKDEPLASEEPNEPSSQPKQVSTG